MSTPVELLRALYGDKSKHSQYQSIPDFISQSLGYAEPIDQGWRGDRARLAHVQASLPPLAGQRWADFGANTGFFTLSLAQRYPDTDFLAIEANPHHSEFIRRLASHFDLANVAVLDRAVAMANLGEIGRCDVLLHLNVLHHAGHDFDVGQVTGAADYDAYSIRYLENLREVAGQMYFQMGSNLWGDKKLPLTPVDDDSARLVHLRRLVSRAGWRFRELAYAQLTETSEVEYVAMPARLAAQLGAEDESALPASIGEYLTSLALDRFPGEFYRRPLLALE